MIKNNITKPIVLIGMMGSGKSTVGRKLARKLKLQFYDSDKVLEEREGLSIIDIHDFMGVKYLQKKEEEVIKEILDYGVIILSTGGSSFTNKNIREYIKAKAISVWLDSNIETICERVSRRNTRPELIAAKDKKEVLKKMMHEREPLFMQADIKVKSDSESHHLVSSLINNLKNFQQSQH